MKEEEEEENMQTTVGSWVCVLRWGETILIEYWESQRPVKTLFLLWDGCHILISLPNFSELQFSIYDFIQLLKSNSQRFPVFLQDEMTKSKNFFQTLLKPFKSSSTRGLILSLFSAEVVNSLQYFFFYVCNIWWGCFFPILCFWNAFTDQHEEDLEEIAAREQKNFSFEALVAATKNFHVSHKLGEGGFGPVFQVDTWYCYDFLILFFHFWNASRFYFLLFESMY